MGWGRAEHGGVRARFAQPSEQRVVGVDPRRGRAAPASLHAAEEAERAWQGHVAWGARAGHGGQGASQHEAACQY